MAPRLALALLVACVGTACGGGPPSPESVVRAWSRTINDGDNEAAARLFAPGARVIHGGATVTLDDEEQAEAFNASVPCSRRIIAIEEAGDTVTATFRLGHRRTTRCDSRGTAETARFRVRDGKIVLWHQLPARGAAAGG